MIKRGLVEWLKAGFSISTQRACRLVGLARSSYYYREKPNELNELLRRKIREISAKRVRFGYQRIHVMLRREGWRVNRKRVYRLYREEGLQIKRKKGKKRPTQSRGNREEATRPNERWAMDFVMDRLEGGGYFRILTVVDQFTRECLALYAGRSLRGKNVAHCLNGIVAKRGRPASITVDNGSEFYSREMDEWAYRHRVELDFIKPGKPVENAYIESFNGRLRDECLNTHLFFGIEDAQAKLSDWKHDYNRERPHGALDDRSPIEFAALYDGLAPIESANDNASGGPGNAPGWTPSSTSLRTRNKSPLTSRKPSA